MPDETIVTEVLSVTQPASFALALYCFQIPCQGLQKYIRLVTKKKTSVLHREINHLLFVHLTRFHRMVVEQSFLIQIIYLHFVLHYLIGKNKFVEILESI